MVRFSFSLTMHSRHWEDAIKASGNVYATEKSRGREQPVLDFFWLSKRVLKKGRWAAEFSSK